MILITSISGCPVLLVEVTSGLLFSMCTFLNYLLFDTQHDPIRCRGKGDNPHVMHDRFRTLE